MKKLRITVEDKEYEVTVEVLEDDESYYQPMPQAAAGAAPAARSAQVDAPPVSAPKPAAPKAAAGDLPSPLAGNVFKVLVKPGDSFTAGQDLIILEAMKMETSISAPSDGTVAAVHVKEGDTVQEGQALISIS
ncbi:MAG: biotin/lipoyl-binding protein [SAR324 cluster bacterium]|nr:biotin/lipoyl-binding protein [SAR324 cluster bacterium]